MIIVDQKRMSIHVQIGEVYIDRVEPEQIRLAKPGDDLAVIGRYESRARASQVLMKIALAMEGGVVIHYMPEE